VRPRFLLDEHISRRVAEEAFKRGLDVRSVDGDPRLAGQEDLVIFREAIREKRILVTYNNGDFAPLLGDMVKAGEEVPGVVFVDEATISNSDIGGLTKALLKLAKWIERKEVDPSGGLFLRR